MLIISAEAGCWRHSRIVTRCRCSVQGKSVWLRPQVLRERGGGRRHWATGFGETRSTPFGGVMIGRGRAASGRRRTPTRPGQRKRSHIERVFGSVMRKSRIEPRASNTLGMVANGIKLPRFWEAFGLRIRVRLPARHQRRLQDDLCCGSERDGAQASKYVHFTLLENIGLECFWADISGYLV